MEIVSPNPYQSIQFIDGQLPLLQLSTNIYACIISHRAGDSKVQHPRLSTTADTVRDVSTYLILPSHSLLCRFQNAIKKVRAVQRMRRNRGFAFSQTENPARQDQSRLIRAYDTSKADARPSGY